jgi:hypothetical protein
VRVITLADSNAVAERIAPQIRHMPPQFDGLGASAGVSVAARQRHDCAH